MKSIFYAEWELYGLHLGHIPKSLSGHQKLVIGNKDSLSSTCVCTAMKFNSPLLEKRMLCCSNKTPAVSLLRNTKYDNLR